MCVSTHLSHLLLSLSFIVSLSLSHSVLSHSLEGGSFQITGYSGMSPCQHYFESVNPILRKTNNTMSSGEQDCVCTGEPGNTWRDFLKNKRKENTAKNVATETYSRGRMTHADVSIMAI